MADKIEDSGVFNLDQDLETQQPSYNSWQKEQFTSLEPDSGLGLHSEATIFTNPNAECEHYELPTAQDDVEVKPTVQQRTKRASDASDMKQQHNRHLLEGTINRPPGGTLIAQAMELHSGKKAATEAEEKEPYTTDAMRIDTPILEAADCGSDEKEANSPNLKQQQEDSSGQVSTAIEEESHVEEPQGEEPHVKETNVEAIIHADPQFHSNTEEDLKVEAVDATEEVVVLIPADDQKTIESVPSHEAEAVPSEHDEIIALVKKMNPADRPQPASIQATFEEVKKPTRLPDDEENCSASCAIPCKGKKCELGYTCTERKCFAVRTGTMSALHWWTDGLTPRWKLLYMFAKIFLYAALSGVKIAIITIDIVQGEHVVFDAITLGLVVIGCLVSLVHAIVFCIRRRREVWSTICETLTYIVLKVYKYCCCCPISCMEKLKEREEEKDHEHEAAEKYAENEEKFKPPQNRCQKFTAIIGNTSEVLLTIVDDVILTVTIILSLYSFMGKQKFTVFFGALTAGNILSFLALIASALNLIVIAHVVRFISVAKNVGSLDKRVVRDCKDMELEPPNMFIRYFLSFQARLVYHVLVSSTFQIYCIFALSWKIIQDGCTVELPSILVGNGSNSSNISPLLGVPFTCNIPTIVNGFTIYNILYIALAPTLLGYTSFFLCNAPWFTEYMQTITMWTFLQIEYMTGFRVRKDEHDGKEDRRRIEDSGKAAYISAPTRLLKLFCSDLLCDVTDEELQGAGKNAAEVRKIIQKDYDTDADKFGKYVIFRALTKLRLAHFHPPAAIVSVLQLVLFIAHVVFMGCGTSECFSSDLRAVFSPHAYNDFVYLCFPMLILFMMTSLPGPWIGIFWLVVIFIVLAIIAIILMGWLLFLMVFCCAGCESKERRIN